MTRVTINNVKGWELNLPESSANEWQGNMKYHNNSWEMPRLRTLERIIKQTVKDKGRCIVYYVGAYKGDMCALLAKWGADLVIMESTPAFWTLIEETWQLNPKLRKPIAFWSGLVSRETKHTGELPSLFEFPTRKAEYIEGHVGFTHLAESKDDVDNFPQITIDDFVTVSGYVPDIITMDIEGSELEAMYGALQTMISYHPTCVLSVHPEFMFHNHGTYERELHDLMRNNGYDKWEWLDYDHEHHWLYESSKK